MKKLFVLVAIFLGFFAINNVFGDDEEINDSCYAIFGDTYTTNGGCPTFEDKCNEALPCKSGYVCGTSGYCEVESEDDDLDDDCGLINDSGIFGNAVCDTCPCQYTYDFNASLRKCDKVLPVVTNPTYTKILYIGDYFEIE